MIHLVSIENPPFLTQEHNETGVAGGGGVGEQYPTPKSGGAPYAGKDQPVLCHQALV